MQSRQFTSSNYIAILGLIWLTLLAIIGLLQLVGAPFGYKVWALGEDRVWLSLIQNHLDASLVQGWWAINDRNPLSAWWWLAVSSFIRSSDWALHVVRRCCDPVLAICTFLLLDRLGKYKSTAFAFSVAAIVLLWNFSSYYESVLWDMLGALTLTLLTLLFYCRYIDSNRTNANDLVISLLCYLFALGTYTIQSGAIIGIAFLAFFRNANTTSFPIRLKNTLKETSYFFALFFFYNAIWFTVNRNSNLYYFFQLPLFLKQFFHSIELFIYPAAYPDFFSKIWHDWSILAILFAWFSAFFAFSYLLMTWLPKKINHLNSTVPIGWVCVILLSIALPTMLLEATSNIWLPGTRSLMVQQVWLPLFYVSIIFTFVNFLPLSSKYKIAFIITAALGATGFLLSLDHNHRLVLRTAYQRNLVRGINKLHIPTESAPVFIVKTSRPSDHDLNAIGPQITMFSQTVFHNPITVVRPLVNYTMGGFDKYWRVNIQKEYATNARTLGDERTTPYSNLWIVFFDGKKVTVPSIVDKKDFETVNLDWNHDGPLDQRLNHPDFKFFS